MIVDRIEAWARERPAKLAVLHNDRAWTYAAFARSIATTRGFLSGQDLDEAATAAVLGADNLRGWIMIMAARSLGLTTAPALTLQDVAALRLPQLRYVLLTEADETSIRAAAPSSDDMRFLVIPDRVLAGYGDAELHRSEPPKRFGDHILYTSGTTGSYKKVRLESDLEDRRNAERARLCAFSPDTVFHALDFGLWTGIGFKSPEAVWHAGGTVVIDQTEMRHANFLKYPVTYAQTIPESLRAIVSARAPGSPPSTELTLRVGGGPAPLDVAQAAVQRVSSRLVVGFSATELNAVVMRSPFRAAEDLDWLLPEEGRVVQVVSEDGDELPPGVEGDLRIKLTELDSKAYLDDEIASARVFRGGYFHPGDRAVKRADGRIRILGRAADVINIRGVKHAVAPIEEELRRVAGVDEVCLFVGSADGVEELVVAVRSAAPRDKIDIQRRLGAIELFEKVRIEVLADFPRTHTGKTKRTELRRLLFPS